MSGQFRRYFSNIIAVQAMLGLLFLWTTLAISSQWIPLDGSQAPRNIQTRIQSSGPGEITLEITVPGIWLDEIASPAGNFIRLSVSDGGVSGDIGRPQIPAIRELIAIPDGGSVLWDVIDHQEQVMSVSGCSDFIRLAIRNAAPQQILEHQR